MHVVVGGYGRVGRLLAKELVNGGHTVAVIDHNPGVFDAVSNDFTGLSLIGEIFDRDTLVKAGIERADAFVACSSGDNSNIIAARIARERFCVPRVIARIFDPQRAAIYESFGIPTVSSVQWSVSRLAALLFEPKARCDYVFGHGEVLLVEIVVPEEIAGKRISEIEESRLVRVVTIERAGTAQMVFGDEVVETGDRLFASVHRESTQELKRILGLQEGSPCES